MVFQLVAVLCFCSVLVTGESTEEDKDLTSFQDDFMVLLEKYEDILPEIENTLREQLEYEESDDSVDFAEQIATDEVDGDEIVGDDVDEGVIVGDDVDEGVIVYDDVDDDVGAYEDNAEFSIQIRSLDGGDCGDKALPSSLSEKEAYKELDFSTKGNSMNDLYRIEKVKIAKVSAIQLKSRKDAYKRYPKNFMKGEGVAFFHALYSYRLTKVYGPLIAKQFGDAHQRSYARAVSSRLMDLFNNEVGRCLGSIKSNHDASDVDVVSTALKAGKLQTKPDASYSGKPMKPYKPWVPPKPNN
ncbi:uncharacterized protein LOC144451263 [Glandiceps talaboti]